MEINQNIAEFYDELYPVTEEQKVFFFKKFEQFKKPAKFLSLGCGTGYFEHLLAKQGLDVTGIENSIELLESANRRRRTQLMSVRYFNMNFLEMSHFLGKKFYNVISVLNDNIIFNHDKTLMQKFFYDCHELLSQNGIFIIKVTNFQKFKSNKGFLLPKRNSIRASLKTEILLENENYYAYQYLQNSSQKNVKITENAKVYPISKEEIFDFAKQTGFTEINFYEDFKETEFCEQSNNIIAVLK